MPKVTIDKHVNIGKDQVIKREMNVFINLALSEMANRASERYTDVLRAAARQLRDAYDNHNVGEKIIAITAAMAIIYAEAASYPDGDAPYLVYLLKDFNDLLTKLITQF